MGIIEKIASFFNSPAEEPLPKLGRNDTCWCGSGKKYKKCHLAADEKKRSRQGTACRTT